MRKIIYISSFFLGIHYFLTIYINSSFLSKFASGTTINLLFALGSILNIILLLIAPHLISKFGGKKITTIFVLVEFCAVLGLAFTNNPFQAFTFFVIHQTLAPIILYCLDLYLERSLPNENNTGRARGIFITFLNSALIVSFLTVSLMVKNENFSPVYILSAAALIPLLSLIIFKFNNDIRSKPYSFSISNSVLFLSKNRDILRILITSFLLQLFYAIMVIYLPLLLHTVPLFNWKEIGTVILVMIIPFIIIEFPLGKQMDKRCGETEVLRLGFIIMASATICLAFIKSPILAVWAAVLFVSRIGASFVEIANESYFFKKVNDRNANIISFFRITQSAAYVLSPLIALPVLYFTDYQNLFAVLGLIMLCGLLFIPRVDTK